MKKPSSKGRSTLILVLIFLLGFCILMYPIVSNWWNGKIQTKAIVNYDAVVQEVPKQDYSQYFEAADAFNETLLYQAGPMELPDSFREEYLNTLKVPGTDIMGYVDIEKLKVELPIYHTTESSVLAVGVGHIEGSSLPVGGPGTHCALSAHRGLPTSKLFSDLDDMEVGDLFTITVLDRLLTYQVDQIKIVLPDELDDLRIEADKDYVTLVTCTPYGINTHRILVRGTRVDNVSVKPQVYVPNEANKIDPLIVTPIVAIPLLILMMIGVSIKYRKK